MNKTLAISAITLVAVLMGISAVVPLIPQAAAEGFCPTGFSTVAITTLNEQVDRNDNGTICAKELPNGDTILIDDIDLPDIPQRPR